MERRQWVVWRFLATGRDEKPRKAPFAPVTGDIASATDPATWGTWEEALAAYRRGGWEGIGYVFAAGASVAGIDLDECIDTETGAIEPSAQAIITAFDSYTERSPSGRGVHILILGSMPGGKGRKRGHYEAYSQGRYFTMTGDWLRETPATIEHRQEELDRFLAAFLPERDVSKAQSGPQRTGNALDDDALLEQMLGAKNRAKVKALWNGDMGGYASQSDADLALCSHLVWWTNGDRRRIDRIFRRSGLMREKWDERRGEQTYGERTISVALDGFGGGYTDETETANSRGKRRPSLATQLVALASDALLFHDGAHDTWSSIPVGTHWETWPLHSKSFKRWLARRLYVQEGRTPSAQAMQDALNVLDGTAMYDRPEMPVHVRLAEHAGAIYLDLADEEWRAVRITAAGWQVIPGDTLPVKFRRPKGMFPLPIPVQGGTLDDLRAFVNVSSEEEWRLLIAWLLGALRPSGPFPALGLNGEMGSAKTTLARALRALVDPNAAPVRAEPKELRDLAIAANNSWAIVLDNLSNMPVWLSDGLCRLSTGGGSAYRTLYENDQETIFDAQRPFILTGIEEVATRGDLVDRAILLTLPTIPDQKRRPESEFWRDFEQKRPVILGALLDAIAGAQQALPQTRLATLPRMADFALWVTAAESTLGWENGSFLKAYTANRTGANTLALESSPVAERLIAFMEDRTTWDDTPTHLYQALSPSVSEGEALPQGWPKTPRGMSGALMRLAPNLRRAGIFVQHHRENDAKRTRKILITKEAVGDFASDASGASGECGIAENKGVLAIHASDAPADADVSSDAQWTHAPIHTMADKNAVWTHLDALDARSREYSPKPFCPRCGRAGDAIKRYAEADGSREEFRCVACDALAEWSSMGA